MYAERQLIIPRISYRARLYDIDILTNCFDSAGLRGGIVIRWLFGTQGISTQISSGKKECPQALPAAESGQSSGKTRKPSVCDRAGSFKAGLQYRQNYQKRRCIWRARGSFGRNRFFRSGSGNGILQMGASEVSQRFRKLL